MGIEPTTDIVCPPLDLKSRRPTRTYPLPIFRLKDFLFKVNPLTPRPETQNLPSVRAARALGLSQAALAPKPWDRQKGQWLTIERGPCHRFHFSVRTRIAGLELFEMVRKIPFLNFFRELKL
jgi:hypothetical protein